MKLKVEYIPIEDIKPYENNAKIHTEEQIEQIKKSIEEFGMNDPIGIWGKENIIIEGHGRLMALKELGWTEVPVIRLDDLTDEQRKAYTLIHNQTTMNTGFDLDILNEELQSIDLDMSFFGFDEIPEPEIDIKDDDFDIEDIEPIKEPKSKRGEIYKLGNHYLMCGDNGIFKGVPLTKNEKEISAIARDIYKVYPTDGKYILTDDKFICCQSNTKNRNEQLKGLLMNDVDRNYIIINPLGEWTGGPDVDTGATNRKLGSDMAQSVTGGGLHGKDLSKADVSVNIYAFLKAQEMGKPVELCCAIGDEYINVEVSDTEMVSIPYSEIVEIAKEYIKKQGGFEKFAEWGLY